MSPDGERRRKFLISDSAQELVLTLLVSRYDASRVYVLNANLKKQYSYYIVVHIKMIFLSNCNTTIITYDCPIAYLKCATSKVEEDC